MPPVGVFNNNNIMAKFALTFLHTSAWNPPYIAASVASLLYDIWTICYCSEKLTHGFVEDTAQSMTQPAIGIAVNLLVA